MPRDRRGSGRAGGSAGGAAPQSVAPDSRQSAAVLAILGASGGQWAGRSSRGKSGGGGGANVGAQNGSGRNSSHSGANAGEVPPHQQSNVGGRTNRRGGGVRGMRGRGRAPSAGTSPLPGGDLGAWIAASLANRRRRSRLARLATMMLGLVFYAHFQTATTKSARSNLRERMQVEDEVVERAARGALEKEGPRRAEGGKKRPLDDSEHDRRPGAARSLKKKLRDKMSEGDDTMALPRKERAESLGKEKPGDKHAYGDYSNKKVTQYDDSPRTPLPVAFDSHLADLTEPLVSARGIRDLPVFWHVPKSGGTTAKDYYGRCLDLVVATESGVREGGVHLGGAPVHPVSFKSNEGDWTVRYVNVDTSTAEGLRHARKIGLVSSGVADAVATPLAMESMGMFDSDDGDADPDIDPSNVAVRGRLFAVFRHPLDRALSTYHYLQHATWEPTYDEKLKDTTLLEYAKSFRVTNNFITRMLARRVEPREDDFGDGQPYMGPLTEVDLEVAKEVLRRKCLVGLMDRMEESVRRFDAYFGWTELAERDEASRKCAEEMLRNGSNRNKRKQKVENGKAKDPKEEAEEKAAMDVLRLKNLFDIRLYEYALELFEKQAELVTPAALDERQRGRRRRRIRKDVKKEGAVKDPSKLSWF